MRSVLCVSLVIQVLLGLTAPVSAQPTKGQELLEFIRDAHRTSREMIQTCSCRVEFKGTVTSDQAKPPKTESCSGRFWYSSDAVRAQVSEFGREVDYLWKDSVSESVARRSLGGKAEVGAARNSFPNRYLGRCDAWVRGLLVLNMPQSVDHVPFEQLVAQATRLKRAERQTVDGKEMSVVQLLFDRIKERSTTWDVEIHFDPAVNYLVRKTIYTTAGANGNVRREDEVVQFKEHAPGVFFPERLVGRSGSEGNYFFNHTSVISDVRINQPLPADIFRFRYPDGVLLTDSVRGAEYRVNSEGKRISPEVPLAGGVPPPSSGMAASSDAGTETQEEPRSLTRWILPVSLGILVLAGVTAFLRHKRRARAAS